MIYGRFGDVVELVRWAVLEDVQALDGRRPDRRDREAIANDSYLVVRYVGDSKKHSKEHLYHQAFLRADGGAAEIARVRDALPRPSSARSGASRSPNHKARSLNRKGRRA